MLTDNMSWIAGYKSKKEDVLKDYDDIIKKLTQMNLEKGNPQEWNIEITTHKIKMKNLLENFSSINLKNQQQDPRNVILSTLTHYIIVYTDWNTKSSFIFYEESQNESSNSIFKTTPTFIQFLENSNSIQKAAQNFKINGSIFQMGDYIIKTGLYKKGMINNIILQLELRSMNFKKKGNYNFIDDPFIKDFLNYINLENLKERISFKKLPQEISKSFAKDKLNGSENNFSWEVDNLLEILDYVLS